MMVEPRWYRQIKWSDPVTIERLRLDRGIVPDEPGVYVFHVGRIAVTPKLVRYVGEAKSLRKRLGAYTIDYMTAKSAGGHLGRSFLFATHKSYPYGLYVRWCVFGGHRNELEASLIMYLQPWYNTRDEEARHSVLADEELLDRRYFL